MASTRILGIDPGSVKCGLGIVEVEGGSVLHHEIVARAELHAAVQRLQSDHAVTRIALGSGTEAKTVQADIAEVGIPIDLVNEYGTTLAARARYFQAKPPRGWKRFIPRGLLVPEEPIDDWAAVIIAERQIALLKESRSG